MMTYFWDGKQAIQVDTQMSTKAAIKYLDMFCVDTYHDGGHSRYGVYSKDDRNGDANRVAWFYIPYVLFPKEFKAHLLLLL